jgi:hypothetical protein
MTRAAPLLGLMLPVALVGHDGRHAVLVYSNSTFWIFHLDQS